MLASLACMAGLILILFRVQDTPSTTWRLFIGLNATVALLVTAAKASLLMAVSACLGQAKWTYFGKRTRHLRHLDILDEASRGPVGALKTLVQIPWGLATVGAFIVLLAVAVDVFAQQVVKLESDFIQVNDGSATFRYAQSYDTGTTNEGHQIGDPFYFDGELIR